MDVFMEIAQAGSGNAMQHAFGNGSSNGTSAEQPTWRRTTILLGIAPIVTLFLGAIASFLIHYVFFDVIQNLASVETPVPGGAGSEKYGLLDDVDGSGKRSDEQTKRSRSPYYVTSGIRSCLKHIHAEAGDLSMFRGLGALICLSGIAQICSPVISWIVSFPLGWVHANRALSSVTTAITALVLAQASTAWTHIVISKPRHKFWFRRLPPTFLSTIKALWIPLLVQVVLEIFIDWVPSLWSAKGSRSSQSQPHRQNGKLLLTDGPPVSIGLFRLLWALLIYFAETFANPALKVFLYAPVSATLTRMQASCLPDDDDPIVSMDRSFSGRPNHGILRQSEPLDLKRACQTMDKPTLVRIFKLHIKLHLINQILGFLLMALVTVEIATLVGWDAFRVFVKLILQVPVVRQDVEGIHGSARDILNSLIANTTIVYPLVSNGTALNTTRLTIG